MVSGNFSYFGLALLLLLLVGCRYDQLPEPDLGPPIKMIHLAHTRMSSNEVFNETLTKVDYSAYDVVLLGGDLAINSSKDRPTMDSLQKIFDLQNENTLWALGNHDYADLPLVAEYTQRPAFYTYTKDKITFLVLDTQDSLSSFVGAQLELIQSVLDTLEQSTHLILLHHKLIWMYGNAELEAQIPNTTNGGLGDCFFCINPNNFYSKVYPLLTEVKKRGIEVWCIGGDLGFKAKTFYYLTPEGIHFLASGMDMDADDNPVILFEYNRKEEKLDWSFNLLKEL